MVSVRVYLSGNPVHDRVLTAFYEGCPESKSIGPVAVYKPADIAVVFGVYKSQVPLSWPRGAVIRKQQRVGRTIILETGYVRRGDGPEDYYAAGFDGLNGRADFRNQGMSGDRWIQLDRPLLSRKGNGDHILVCGQLPWDASVDGSDHRGWIKSTIAGLERGAGRPVVFRPHPLIGDRDYGVRGVEISVGPLSAALEGCWAVVTYNSNTAVDAAIQGYPVFALDRGSMAWAVAGHDLAEIDSPSKPDRTQWAADLAYSQWKPAEMAEGLTWRHLSR